MLTLRGKLREPLAAARTPPRARHPRLARVATPAGFPAACPDGSLRVVCPPPRSRRRSRDTGGNGRPSDWPVRAQAPSARRGRSRRRAHRSLAGPGSVDSFRLVFSEDIDGQLGHKPLAEPVPYLPPEPVALAESDSHVQPESLAEPELHAPSPARPNADPHLRTAGRPGTGLLDRAAQRRQLDTATQGRHRPAGRLDQARLRQPDPGWRYRLQRRA